MLPTARLRLYTQTSAYVRMALNFLLPAPARAISETEILIAGYTKAKHCVLTSMGRMAIYEGLRALGRQGEIIMSPITVPEVVSLVALAGYTPVFCDVAEGTWNMDVALIESKISPRTTAIMTTHFFGNMNTAKAMRALCDKHGLAMVEDAAQAIGAWQEGKHAGTLADFAILSFSYPKNVTSFFGGALITNRDDIASRVRQQIANYPESSKAWVYKRAVGCIIKDVATYPLVFLGMGALIRYGYVHNIDAIKKLVEQRLNAQRLDVLPPLYASRISPAQAQVVSDKWPEIDEDVAHRIACAQVYDEAFRDIAQIVRPTLSSDRSHTYLYYPIQVENKYALQQFMIEQGCDVAVQHAANCSDLEAYAAYGNDCPRARAAYQGTVTLPTYRGFPLEAARRYAEVVRRYFL